jgi:hypothetical protein
MIKGIRTYFSRIGWVLINVAPRRTYVNPRTKWDISPHWPSQFLGKIVKYPLSRRDFRCPEGFCQGMAFNPEGYQNKKLDICQNLPL